MIFVSVLLAFVACVRGLPASEEILVSPMPAADGLFRVYTLPVGQGDARVIRCPSGEISIFDMGTCSAANRGFWTATNIRIFLSGSYHLVTNIFISHNDKDHYSLLDKVFLPTDDLRGLKSIYISRQLNDSNISIQNWVDDINATDKVTSFNGGNTCGSSGGPSCGFVDLCPWDSGITTQVLSVNAGQQCNSARRMNNTDSIVLGITYNSFRLQLNGDFEDCGTSANEEGPLKKMADAYYRPPNLPLTVYMLSHHGAASKANKKVIRDAVRPKAVVASSDPWFNTRRLGHPRCAIIDAFITDVRSLCKPGETDALDQFYCGQHPFSTAALVDKLQDTYTCGENGTLRNVTENDYAVYTTRPNSTHFSFIELQTNGNQWGFVNWNFPLFNQQTTSESMDPEEDEECVDESSTDNDDPLF